MRTTAHLNVDDIDAEINIVQRQYIQPLARLPGEATCTTLEANQGVDMAAEIAADIYRLNFVRDITFSSRGRVMPLLGDSSTNAYGARYHNGRLVFVGVPAGRKLLITYYRLLTTLGEGTDEAIVPDIPEVWHDLYWLGAAAMINPERYYPLFQDRLREFKLDRISETRPHGTRVRASRRWW